MKHPKEIEIDDYNYNLPELNIAKEPLENRQDSRLLSYKDGNIKEDTFYNIADLLPTDSILVFNETRVIKARLYFKKETGGIIEIFCLSPKEPLLVQDALVQKERTAWNCLVGGASKWKHGSTLELVTELFTLFAKIIERTENNYIVEFTWNNNSLDFSEILKEAGKVPLPPYLNRDATKADINNYQTIYAKREGSVAAPTAGLHFTHDVLEKILSKEIEQLFLTLHVSAGTFKPVKSATMLGHSMHEEWIEIESAFVDALIENYGKKIIAVGTTSLRTLESIYWIGYKLINDMAVNFRDVAVEQWEVYELNNSTKLIDALQAVKGYMIKNELSRLVTKTQILIAPGYQFKVVDVLVTNFHQPKSTLLLLVAAFTGNKWKEIYEYALTNNFRFLSYGDGSLLWRVG